MSKSKILYMFDASDWESRMAVANKARELGHEVVLGLINADAATQEKGKAAGFTVRPLQKSANSMGVLSGLSMARDMRALIKQEQPDIMHTVTLKYGFMASLAARPFKDLRKINTMAGLGYLFRSDDTKSAVLRAGLKPFLRHNFRRPNTTMIFQNVDDLELMVREKYVKSEDCVLIKGSGVYLDRFTPKTSDGSAGAPIVLMPTRLVHEKGVAVFVEAARLLKDRGVQAQFQIAGGETKHNPKAISRAQMEEMVSDGSAQWLGRVNDMPDLLSNARLVVYPSYYGEGIPRVLLESCAAGRAIVTTDHPGCREAVDHGLNGQLVPVKDAFETANAIEALLSDDGLRTQMEVESRIKAENEFDIHKIVDQTIALYA